MSVQIPQSHFDLINGPILVTLTTLMPDGQPQSSIVWCNSDGENVWVNTARGRQKDKNMIANPKVTLLALDPNDAYRYIEIRGVVDEITEVGAADHISELAGLYMNAPAYYGHVAPAELAKKETRVIYKIRPTKVRTLGG